jgi:A/G-specific adenine glycosylase
MLQQTQVDRVIPFYAAWLKKFPTWSSLAHAKTDALIHAWAGLGYNRRALYLREAARIVESKGTPQSLEDWRSLPGMGPYASAAVFGFTKRKFVPAIDTNVRRVIGRIFLGIPYPNPGNDDRVLKRLTSPPIRLEIDSSPQTSRHLTSALMDFGSLICTSKNPQCIACPLRDVCHSKKYFLTHPTQPRNHATTQRTKERRHLSKQFPDRIYRGRILALVRKKKKIEIKKIGALVDPTFNRAKDESWMDAMIQRLVAEGFLERKNFLIALSKA